MIASRIKVLLRSVLLSLGLGAASVHAAQPHAGDMAELSPQLQLQLQMQQALWPADIVHLADQYLSRYPGGSWADSAYAIRERAGTAMRALSGNDVRLYRTAFQPGEPTAADDLRRAALGDKDAAVRIAHQFRVAEAHEQSRYVGWLQYAAMLGDAKSNYELALFYRRESQPVMASKYEERAVELGFTLPRDLDNVRK